MIERLGFEGLRIFSAKLTPSRHKLVLSEDCDGWFTAELTRAEVEELAEDLLNLAAQMVPSNASAQT